MASCESGSVQLEVFARATRGLCDLVLIKFTPLEQTPEFVVHGSWVPVIDKPFLTHLQPLHLFQEPRGAKLRVRNWTGNQRVGAMSEFQKIAIGLLGMSHPEIHRYRSSDLEPAARTAAPTHAPRQTRGRTPTPAASALRALKFAFAALLAGARTIPLGDNGRITRELGEYGAHLQGY
jgi:hypothetical protein